MSEAELWNLRPLLQVALTGALVALIPLTWIWLRAGRASRAGTPHRLARLTALILFLTFDLVVFGAYTRLSDSGLGCPDWPGCYGSASPLGAREHIEAAQQALPSGPVTHRKAWIEMIHRYLASAVGVLIVVLTVARVQQARQDGRQRALAGWAAATLAWVIGQGLFGALTVTMKLYPLIVTLHLLGGLGLLVLLTVQATRTSADDWATVARAALPPPALRRVVGVTALLVGAQVALGGWVSTNYAVLACTDFPTCQGRWWPDMDLAGGFRLLRPLGQDGQGGWLGAEAFVAIHMVHRLGAAVVLVALAWLGARLRGAARQDPAWARSAWTIWALAAWQFASGLSNVVLGWPLAAALAHTAGAAALVVVLTGLWVRTSAGTARANPATLGRRPPIEASQRVNVAS